MELVFLGCGTSTGVPIVGCDCDVCKSDNPHNKRSRSSVFVRCSSGKQILIDTTPDLRTQALTNNLKEVNAVFFTHTHADHIHGIDELRTFNYLQQAPIDIYGVSEHLDYIKHRFAYIFEKSVQRGGGKPQLIENTVNLFQSFELFGVPIVPLKLMHGKLLSVGWRIGDIAYLTDVNYIPDETFKYLKNLEVLVLGALRYEHHPTHYTIDEAIILAEKINAKQCYITHMGHAVEYNDAYQKMPDRIKPAFDGLRIVV